MRGAPQLEQLVGTSRDMFGRRRRTPDCGAGGAATASRLLRFPGTVGLHLRVEAPLSTESKPCARTSGPFEVLLLQYRATAESGGCAARQNCARWIAKRHSCRSFSPT